MSVQPLPPEKLRRACRGSHLNFETTAELESNGSIIGQPRGTRAIEFGIGIEGEGYNIFVVGESGTGRSTAIQRFLQEQATQQPAPPDWVYVYNFDAPHRPRAIALPAGRGAMLKRDVESLIESARKEMTRAFSSEMYQETVAELEQKVSAQQDALLSRFEEGAAEENFALMHTASGPVLAPVSNGNLMPHEVLETLPIAQRQSLEKKRLSLRERLDSVMQQVHHLQIQLQEQLEALDRNVTARAIAHYFQTLRDQYEDIAEVQEFLSEMERDIVRHLYHFLPNEEQDVDLRRYDVNLFVDNGETKGAPVVLELNPDFTGLMGRMEYEQFQGMLRPHFMAMRPGSLHKANGGYLIIYARDLRRHREAWEALKRALKAEEIRLQLPVASRGGHAPAQSLDPEPIPLDLKVVLVGGHEHYYAFYDREEDFAEMFKVKADFDSSMVRDEMHELQYARFIADRCASEGLRHFERAAVEKIIEFGSRLSEDQNRLSAHFGTIADVLREANYWAGREGRDAVSSDDVQQALRERVYRANSLEEEWQEQILEGDLLIASDGNVVGQVNSLSVIDLGDYVFGMPGRITARTYIGEDGVVNIEREVDLAGPIHNKGLLTLIGYLGGMYAQNQPLSLSASLTFEQNYAGVDGDSASAAELYALLSSLSGLAVRQSIAVTGSVNQHGEMQAVGGVNEKIEGYFRLCNERGLTGEQGVLIPRANVNNLMLSEEVVEAVQAGRFQVWAAGHVDEGLSLLLGKPAGEPQEDGTYPEGTVHYEVQKALRRLALELKSFGDHDHDHDHDHDPDHDADSEAEGD
jgi:predicted ATP-dependent protease